MNPVAISLGPVNIHWYGIFYVLALLTALYFAKWIVSRDNLPITQDALGDYFIWAEIGVILGARIGFILLYEHNKMYYLTQPWEIFNPFYNGQFVGIRGMSYFGALMGFLIASLLYARKHKVRFWFLMDLVGVAVPVGYVFGRIGNFLNQELYGRPTDVEWGIYVAGILRHPSQLYEAVLEGVVVGIILFWYRTKTRFVGEIALLYGFLYGLSRFTAEFWRQYDTRIGLMFEWMTRGQLFSVILMVVCLTAYWPLYQHQRKAGAIRGNMYWGGKARI